MAIRQHVSSLYSNRQPAREIALRILNVPGRADFFREIVAGDGIVEETIKQHPHYSALVSQKLVRFYSSYKRRKPWLRIFVLAKGREVLQAMDELESYVYLVGN